MKSQADDEQARRDNERLRQSVVDKATTIIAPVDRFRGGIGGGFDDPAINPLSNITRSEVAAILTRLYDIDARRQITLG